MHVRLQHPAEPRKMRLRMCNAGVIEILSQSSGVHLIRGQFGYRKLLYVKVIFDLSTLAGLSRRNLSEAGTGQSD